MKNARGTVGAVDSLIVLNNQFPSTTKFVLYDNFSLSHDGAKLRAAQSAKRGAKVQVYLCH